MTYHIAKQAKKLAEDTHNAAVVALKAASGDKRGPFGLTPDSIKSTPEWQAAFRAERKAFADLRAMNRYVAKNYAKEQKAERDAKRLGAVA